ncbi:MAG: DUF751 family protein [Leptolyngbyaceae cyanobacterium bins.349]|nr:DUF751 family protein [Leptolyngbyaceae cyanobacterium bins.349]
MQSFWNTIAKYPIFLAGALLSVFLGAIQPLLPLLKNPVTAIALVGVFIGGFAFLTFTLRAMLGLQAV